jgi:hypothetical protein
MGGRVGWVDGWVLSARGMGSPFTSSNMYISHGKVFTSKITEEGEPSGGGILVSFFLRCTVIGKKYKRATNHC